jgi:EAL domain-containing protein (putative c-di-GMP-specific phosphodiesterase class I)
MTAIDLGQELDKIISRGAIEALFQPIFNIQTQKVHGVEALSRGPTHSPLYSPVSLFQTAEHHGRLSELETLCRRISLCEFTQRQLPGKLFINISPKALLDPDHPKGVTLALLHKLGIPPSQVVIELSEQHPADDIDLLKSCLNHYRSQGFLTAIDDLGTGYSGLRLWSELAPDYVKIDRHFIHEIDTSPVKQEFVRSIVDLCQSLTCKVIAEGIETQGELAVLQQLGIVYCQGFLLGRPEERPVAQLPPNMALPSQAPQTRYGESIESLSANALTAPPTASLRLLSERFISQPALQAIVIAEGEQALGLVSRSSLLELFSTPFGRARHEHQPAHSVMDTRVLRFDARAPLTLVSQRLTRNSEHTMAQHFLVTRQGRLLGIGHTKDLLQRITEHMMARHANPLTALPGKVPIQEELKRLHPLHEPFNLACFDLCNFKPIAMATASPVETR